MLQTPLQPSTASLEIPNKQDSASTAKSVPAVGGAWRSPERPTSSGTSLPRTTPQWLDLEVKQRTDFPTRRMTSTAEYTTDAEIAASLNEFRRLQHPQIVIRRSASRSGSDVDPGSLPSEGMATPRSLGKSPNFSTRGESAVDDSAAEEGDVICEIELTPCPSDQMVPFIRREESMKKIIKQNAQLFEDIRYRVGTKKFKEHLMPLWTEHSRAKTPDFKWLLETRTTIVPEVDGPDNRKVLWRKFAQIVGWDGNDDVLDEARGKRFINPHGPHNRRGSTLDTWKDEELYDIREESEEAQSKYLQDLQQKAQSNQPTGLFFQ